MRKKIIIYLVLFSFIFQSFLLSSAGEDNEQENKTPITKKKYLILEQNELPRLAI